nr:hypothetical protein CFP56_69666 [Quercus suber]
MVLGRDFSIVFLVLHAERSEQGRALYLSCSWWETGLLWKHGRATSECKPVDVVWISLAHGQWTDKKNDFTIR